MVDSSVLRLLQATVWTDAAHVCHSNTSVCVCVCVAVSSCRTAPMRSERYDSSSSWPGPTTACQSTPPPSWPSYGGSRRATLRTPAPWWSTAGTCQQETAWGRARLEYNTPTFFFFFKGVLLLKIDFIAVFNTKNDKVLIPRWADFFSCYCAAMSRWDLLDFLCHKPT